MRCPNCGHDLAETALTEREQRALAALRIAIQRGGGRYPTTLAVAHQMNYSKRWAYEFLRRLEELGFVHRPDGPKSGWAITHNGEHHVRLTLVA